MQTPYHYQIYFSDISCTDLLILADIHSKDGLPSYSIAITSDMEQMPLPEIMLR
jgi:hypothetical protein